MKLQFFHWSTNSIVHEPYQFVFAYSMWSSLCRRVVSRSVTILHEMLPIDRWRFSRENRFKHGLVRTSFNCTCLLELWISDVRLVGSIQTLFELEFKFEVVWWRPWTANLIEDSLAMVLSCLPVHCQFNLLSNQSSIRPLSEFLKLKRNPLPRLKPAGGRDRWT